MTNQDGYRADQHSRRNFLQQTAGWAAGAGLFAGLNGCAVGDSASTAQEANMASQNKKGPTPNWPVASRDKYLRDVDAPDSWAAMEAVGAEGMEVRLTIDGKCVFLYGDGREFSIATPEDVKVLAERQRHAAGKITAFCLGNQFDKDTEAEVAFTIKTARVAAELGVPALRIDLMPHRLRDDEPAFLKLAVQVVRRILAETADTNVRFGVENHGGTTNKVEFLRDLFVGVGSDRFGLTLDTGNFYWFGYPLSRLYDIYAEFAATACHTHCKSICYPWDQRDKQRPMGFEYGKYCCPIDKGDIDFTKVAGILKAKGYRGDLCIENESLGKFPPEQVPEVLARELAYLKKVRASV